MKLSRSYIFFIFLLALSQDSIAQTQDVKISLVTGMNGISLGKINGMARDRYGFIWFSDQSNRCIIRYDGNKMIRYQNDIKNSNSLGGAYPECLFADSSGIIWIGFYGMGLDRFDPISNTFTHYRHKQDDPESLCSDYVSAIVVDHLGNVWLGTDGGLDLLNITTGKFKHYGYKADDPRSLSNNFVRVICEDKAGELWIGTGYPWDVDNEGGLNLFNRSTGTFTRYVNDPKNQFSLIDNKVRAIFEDSYGNFWIGTRGDGLHLMDRKAGLFTRMTHSAAKPDRLSRPPVKGPADHITFITEDADKKLWIGTFENGVLRYDPESKKTSHYTDYIGNTTTTKDTSSWSVLASPDGLVWLGTQNANLYTIDLHNNIVPHYSGNTSADGTRPFCEESPTILWLGTDRGLVRKDLVTGDTKRFVHEQNNPNSLSHNYVRSILKDKRGYLWIGTYGGGLNRFDPATKTFTHYADTNAQGTPQLINVLHQDRDSTIWIGTAGGGLNNFDPQTGEFTQYFRIDDKINRNTFNVNANFVYTILEDDSIYLWLGMPTTGGVSRMNRQTKEFKVYLPSLTINCSYKDKDGFVWMGTDGGLFRYNKESDNFYTGAEINDAANIPNAVSIIGDDENNLWIVSTPGIYKLNPRRDHIILYGKENGIAQGNDFYYNSAYKSREGKLYFGYSNGYYAFYPDKIDNKSVPTQLYFTNFWLNNNEIHSGTNSPLKKTILETDEILLKYDQNVFSFGFSVLDFRKGDNRVYYKLENYDNDWRTAGSENKAEYYKVPPGKYVLHVKTSNSSSGVWMEKTIAVIITPPWWSTWWAYCIYGLLFVALALSVHRYQRARLIRAERERTRAKELVQAKEIEKAYHKLRTTQAQLIQSEKMASLGELTAGIAHEIQNPLNFVNNFSEVNEELLMEMKDDVINGNTNEALILANDAIENQKKITIHGKRADAIVKGMLQHSRTSTNQKEPTDINALADEYLRLAYYGLRAKEQSFNATMKTDFDDSIGGINIVPQDIGRVLLNLYNNAFYAVNERKKTSGDIYDPVVWVNTKKIGDEVEIRVGDNGNGISQKIIDKIFQPFFTTKPTGQGTGLGLSLSYDIVKAHGGEVKVETRESEFTEFIIQLPAMSE